ncbi:hypothetical protein O0I10_004771, partial [Lichtheimia ornata]
MRYPFLFAVAAAYAQAATFKVVAPGAKNSVQVVIDGARTNLHANDTDVPYFVGDASCDAPCSYKYAVDGVEEDFHRKLEGATTRNDVYSRPVTYADLPDLPHPIKKDPQWTRGGPKGDIWDDHYIPSIFITGNPGQMQDLVKNVVDEKFDVKFTIIGPDDVHSFTHCNFGLHGAGKSKNNAKQSWEWSLPEGQYLDNRNWFKIRHMEEDPTQMREKLYADVLDAMGAHGNRANMVRLFINGQGFGTFNMLDDVIEYSYIRAVFYNGKPPKEMGPLYDGMTGADFRYTSDSEHYEAWAPNDDSPEDEMALQDLARAFSKIDMDDDRQLQHFENTTFNVDQFLRFMVVEYLAADWDGYWMEQTNDGAYQDPAENGRWYYLGQDYDATFGVNLVEPEGREFVNVSYKEFPERYPDAVMINRLLENKSIRKRFETYLKDTVRILFNDQVLGNRVLAYREYIEPDLKWDRSIRQQSPGINFGWTFEQTKENLYKKVKSPNDNGGGADWGLLEWISARSKAVANEFNLKIMSQEEAMANDALQKQ